MLRRLKVKPNTEVSRWTLIWWQMELDPGLERNQTGPKILSRDSIRRGNDLRLETLARAPVSHSDGGRSNLCS